MTDAALDPLEAEFERIRQLKKERTNGQKSSQKSSGDSVNGKGQTGKAKKARPADVRSNSGAADQGGPIPETAHNDPVRAPVPEKSARAPAVGEDTGFKGIRPPRFEPNVRTLAHHPRKHEPGSLIAGNSVWYRNERYYISQAPADWHDTSFIMLSSSPVRPGSYTHRDSISFFVHADLVELAPVHKTIFHDQPTKQRVETEAKKKELGITDVGDEVGELLRGRSLDEVYAIAAKYLHAPEEELRAKYQHLNPGQQRMVCGNRMRKRK